MASSRTESGSHLPGEGMEEVVTNDRASMMGSTESSLAHLMSSASRCCEVPGMTGRGGGEGDEGAEEGGEEEDELLASDGGREPLTS